VLHVIPEKQAWTSDLHVDGTTLENALLRVVVDPKSGCITSLFDKNTKFEALAANSCGNELQAFHDKPKDYDAWISTRARWISPQSRCLRRNAWHFVR